MHTESAQVINFPQPQRQSNKAKLQTTSNGLISQCQLMHNNAALRVVAVVDIPHQWQQGETVTVIHNNNRAIITGCDSTPDNCYTLRFHFHSEKINLEFGHTKTGEKLSHYNLLCGNTTITIDNSGGLFIDNETLDNNGFWCLSLMGFKHYVI